MAEAAIAHETGFLANPPKMNNEYLRIVNCHNPAAENSLAPGRIPRIIARADINPTVSRESVVVAVPVARENSISVKFY